MSYHPLQLSGKITLIDIAREKNICGPTSLPTVKISLNDCVHGIQGVPPPLNLYNHPDIIARIQAHPHKLSGWYGYNHNLGPGSVNVGRYPTLVQHSSNYVFTSYNQYSLFTWANVWKRDWASAANTTGGSSGGVGLSIQIALLQMDITIRRCFLDFNMSISVPSGYALTSGTLKLTKDRSSGFPIMKPMLLNNNSLGISAAGFAGPLGAAYYESGFDPVDGAEVFKLSGSALSLIETVRLAPVKRLYFLVTHYRDVVNYFDLYPIQTFFDIFTMTSATLTLTYSSQPPQA